MRRLLVIAILGVWVGFGLFVLLPLLMWAVPFVCSPSRPPEWLGPGVYLAAWAGARIAVVSAGAVFGLVFLMAIRWLFCGTAPEPRRPRPEAVE